MTCLLFGTQVSNLIAMVKTKQLGKKKQASKQKPVEEEEEESEQSEEEEKGKEILDSSDEDPPYQPSGGDDDDDEEDDDDSDDDQGDETRHGASSSSSGKANVPSLPIRSSGDWCEYACAVHAGVGWMSASHTQSYHTALTLTMIRPSCLLPCVYHLHCSVLWVISRTTRTCILLGCLYSRWGAQHQSQGSSIRQ